MKSNTQLTTSAAAANLRLDTNNQQELREEDLQNVTGGLHVTKVSDASSPLLFLGCA